MNVPADRGGEIRASIRALRWRILSLDRESDFHGFLVQAARYLVAGTRASEGGIVVRFPDQGEDFLLWLGADGVTHEDLVPLPEDGGVPLRARGEAHSSSGFSRPELEAFAQRNGATHQRVLLAGLTSPGRRNLQVELADPDPEVLPDPPAMAELLAEVGAAFELAYLYDASRRERLEMQKLLEVGRELGRTVDVESLLTSILRLLAPVVPYDAAAIYVIGEGELDVACQSVGYGSDEAVRIKMNEGIVGRVARTEHAEVIPDVSRDPEYFLARTTTVSELVVPVVSGGKVLGVFNLESDRRNAFTPHHLQLLTMFAVQAGVALERARLLEAQEAKRRIDQELEIARLIQRTFLPRPWMTAPERGLSARTLPSRTVSGDYYDVLDREDGVAVAVADVSGKGIPASLIMAALRTGFHLLGPRETPGVLCRDLNEFLHTSLRETEFVTGVFGVLDRDRRRFRYCNAGHDLPFVMRADGSIETLDSGGPLLGVIPGAGYEEAEVELRAGDRIVLYTDGVTEAFREGVGEFGLERLQRVVRDRRTEAAPGVVGEVVRAVRDHVGGPLPDDLTVLVIEGRSVP